MLTKTIAIAVVAILFLFGIVACGESESHPLLDLPDNAFFPFNERGELVWNKESVAYVHISFAEFPGQFAYADIESFFDLMNGLTKEFVDYFISENPPFDDQAFFHSRDRSTPLFYIGIITTDGLQDFFTQIRAFMIYEVENGAYMFTLWWHDGPTTNSLFRINSDDLIVLNEFMLNLERQNSFQ